MLGRRKPDPHPFYGYSSLEIYKFDSIEQMLEKIDTEKLLHCGERILRIGCGLRIPYSCEILFFWKIGEVAKVLLSLIEGGKIENLRLLILGYDVKSLKREVREVISCIDGDVSGIKKKHNLKDLDTILFLLNYSEEQLPKKEAMALLEHIDNLLINDEYYQLKTIAKELLLRQSS